MSQAEMILAYLKSGKAITPAEALEMFGCFRLAARISDLKAQGHNILVENIAHHGKMFARYYLAKTPQAVFSFAVIGTGGSDGVV